MTPLGRSRRSFIKLSVALAGTTPLIAGLLQAQSNEASGTLTAYVGTFSSPLGLKTDRVERMVRAGGVPVQVVENAFLPLLKIANLGIVASGTATLQVGMAGIPFLVVYRVTYITYRIVKWFLYVKDISIVNILANREIAPELLQHDFTPEAVRDAFLSLVSDPERRAAMKADLQDVAGQLGQPGAYGRAADLLAERLRGLT